MTHIDFNKEAHKSAAAETGVIEYVTEEVTRQGHDVTTLDGIERVAWMLNAWRHALLWNDKPRLFWFDIEELGKLIEPEKNRIGFRNVHVRVGRAKPPAPSRVHRLVDEWTAGAMARAPLDAYREFEEIHPFIDGNGRTGKILLNWLNGTLLNPVFPPSDFWGKPIRNP